MNYPRYKCHKVVNAFKVGKIEGCTIFPLDESLSPYQATPEFIGKHPLNLDGYIVFYEDGYVSFSPADAFEGGYLSVGSQDETAQVFKALQDALKRDAGYALSWHCNISMASVDNGMSYEAANKAAALFMRNCFNVDTSQPPEMSEDLCPNGKVGKNMEYLLADDGGRNKIMQLMKFYCVNNVNELVLIQSQHVGRLQVMIPTLRNTSESRTKEG